MKDPEASQILIRELLDGIGGFTCYGVIDNAEVSRREDLLPMGLSDGCRLKADVVEQDERVVVLGVAAANGAGDDAHDPLGATADPAMLGWFQASGATLGVLGSFTNAAAGVISGSTMSFTTRSRPALQAFLAAGVTRASFGVQDFDPAVQEAVPPATTWATSSK